MKSSLIAITGQTGVGKTYLLKKYNYKKTIYIDDYVKKVLYLKGSPIFDKITQQFGKSIVEKEKINPQKLGQIVLASLKKLEELTKIVNPEIKKYLKSLAKETYIVEIATYLKYETYFKEIFNKVVLITNSNPHLESKFPYLEKAITMLENRNIKYAYHFNRDQSRSDQDFFKILDKLTSFEKS